MQKYRGVAVGVIILALFIVFGSKLPFREPTGSDNPDKLAFPVIPSTLSFPTLEATPVGLTAWDVWRDYLAAVNAHDLEKVKALSYQLSATCLDESQRDKCNGLMDSIYFFGNGLKQSDFTHVVYDAKQIVLSTPYLLVEDSKDPIKTVLYFVRDVSGAKILGLRFCAGIEDAGDECVETSAEKRDQDQDGWWDDVEVLFKK